MTQQNLPRQSTSFVGRSKEIAEINTLLQNVDCHLLTLLGVGGIGKTRLALAVAERQLDNFEHGVYFVPLQSIDSAENILPTTANILNIEFHNNASSQEQFLHFLQDKHLLLIMDNFEHLLDGVCLLLKMIQNAPHIRIIVTSREALNLPVEWLHHVKGMHYPKIDNDDVVSYSAIKLFAERARQVRNDFSLVLEKEHVVRICQLAEGMPLGIELAAGWLKRLACSDIVSEIERNLDFLATDLHGIPQRHRSIRAVFNHSWQLMSDEEQAVFMKLSVFRGGFTREAVEVVTGASLLTISDLVDKSLLRLSSDGRYDVHELLRQYAEEKLTEIPDVLDSTLDKYCRYYAQFFNIKQEPNFFIEVQNRESISQEIDNIRAAWDHASENSMIDEIQKLIFVLGLYYRSQNWYQAGIEFLKSAIEILSADNLSEQRGIALGFALSVQGGLLNNINQLELAEQRINEGIAILRDINAEYVLGNALRCLSDTLLYSGRVNESQTVIEEILTLATKFNLTNEESNAKGMLAHHKRILGHYNKAKSLVEEVLAAKKQDQNSYRDIRLRATLAEIIQEMGQYQQALEYMHYVLPVSEKVSSRWYHGQHYEWLGHIEHGLGNYDVAYEALQVSLHIAREHGTPRRIAFSLVALGDLMIGMRDYDRAEKYHREAVTLSRQSKQIWQEAWGLRGLGQVAYLQGDYKQAQDYLEIGLDRSRRISWMLGIAQNYQILGLVAVAQNKLDGARHNFYNVLDTNLASEAPPVILATLVGIAELSVHQEQIEHAIELLGLVLNHSATHADTRHRVQDSLEELQDKVNQDVFEAAFQRGETSDLEQVVAILMDELADHIEPIAQEFMQPLDESLTKTELEILKLMRTSLSYPEIAEHRNVSLNTIKTHRSNIYSKLAVNTREEAILKASTLNLI